ncbi:MAG TPA: DUF992 domain-containing protein [Methylomirabilota bacterium]|nr:DUF992 domain-containing protein [Methylomirabilota bacterium]
MSNRWRSGLAAAVAATALGLGAAQAQSGVKAGYLNCQVAGSVSFIFGSSRNVSCLYRPSGVQRIDRYRGEIKKFGVDIGFYGNGVMVWAVIAPTSDVGPGALSGDYGGVSADAAAGYGVGANALVGGGHKSIALQPVSVEGVQGLNIAAGVGVLNLRVVH